MKKNAPTRQTILRKLYSPVLSDVLDSLGYRRQAMRPFVRPLDEDLVLFGRARTGCAGASDCRCLAAAPPFRRNR